MFINLRARLIPILVLIAGSGSPSAAAADRQWSVTVCGSSADPRQEAVREAVEFWNAKLSSIGAGLKLGPINSCDRVIPDDLLRQMSDGAVTLGRFTPLPAELNGIKGNVIVVLSDADLVSFAESGTATRPGLVVLRRPDIPPLSLPNVQRNVVAHEMGHVLGLPHNNDPKLLMCGRPAPCRPALFESPAKRFFPLTDRELNLLATRFR